MFLKIASLLLLSSTLTAQWDAGDVYREYIWVTPGGEGEAFLRVGGRYGYTEQPGKLPDSLQRDDRLVFPQSLDLNGATHATLTLEKVLGHEDSRDLRLSVNGGTPISVPEPADVPAPQTEYMYHTDVSVSVPLDELIHGHGNTVKLTLDTSQRWGWPQNLFYALIIRVHYPAGTAPQIDYACPAVPALSYLRVASPRADDRAADYILVGRETDWSGRGVQERKHWQTHRGRPLHTLGSSDDHPGRFATAWDTRWLPDQHSFGVQARVLGVDGKYRVSKVLDGLQLAPRPYRVSVYGGEAPRNWVTRSGAFEQIISVAGDVETAIEMQLQWVSWSPCYGNGVFLNGHLVWDRHEKCYAYATHSPEFSGAAMEYLQSGENIVSTALTPLFRGQMVHGMEVQWPGMQIKVMYGSKKRPR